MKHSFKPEIKRNVSSPFNSCPEDGDKEQQQFLMKRMEPLK